MAQDIQRTHADRIAEIFSVRKALVHPPTSVGFPYYKLRVGGSIQTDDTIRMVNALALDSKIVREAIASKDINGFLLLRAPFIDTFPTLLDVIDQGMQARRQKSSRQSNTFYR